MGMSFGGLGINPCSPKSRLQVDSYCPHIYDDYRCSLRLDFEAKVVTPTLPLKICLDSADYSFLSDPHKADIAAAPLHKLLGWINEGKVIAYFGLSHVIESAPIHKTSDQLCLSAARFRIIQKICGPNCFLDIFSLLKAELCKEEAAGYPEILRSDGHWFPPIGDIELPNAKGVFESKLSEAPLNRHQRRTAKAKLFKKGNRLSDSIQNGIRESFGNIDIRSQFPLTDEAFSVFSEYLCGNTTAIQVRDALKGSLSDLNCFAKWYITHWNDVSPTSRWLRESGTKTQENLIKMHKTLLDVRDVTTVLDAQRFNSLLQNELKKMSQQLITETANSIRQAFATSAVDSPKTLPTWDNTPSYLTLISVFASLLQLTALAINQPRKPKQSDFGDVIHTLYLPHVDLFRADGFASEAIKNTKLPWETKICSSLDQLIFEIEKKLSRHHEAAINAI